MKKLVGFILLFAPMLLIAQTYCGRVCSADGAALPYATIYLKSNPMVGTATNAAGLFSLMTDESPQSVVVVSCMGFATQEHILSDFSADTLTLYLAEQPIELAVTTVEAAKTRQSKRKRMAAILHEVYTRLEQEYPNKSVQYGIVSDVKMEARSSSWGMEEMLATVVQIPATQQPFRDSIQFRGSYCKRYCNPVVRVHADSLLRQETDKRRKRIALEIDSGTIVHHKMWEMSQLQRENLLDVSDELARWKMQTTDDGHTILTYTRKRDFLGIVKITEVQDLLIDNTGALLAFTQEEQVKVFLPFSIKIKDSDLGWVNLLNMDDDQLMKFRLKKANMTVRFQTLYTRKDGLLVSKEKNMHVTALLEDNKKNQLPCEMWASQHITSVQTDGVQPLRNYRARQKVARELVPIY